MPHARRVLALAKSRFGSSFAHGVGLVVMLGGDIFKNTIEFLRL